MKPTVYVETTVISYLTSRPSRDVVVAGHQQVTREWWESTSDKFELLISELVVREVSQGDASAIRERLAVAEALIVLEVTIAARELARQLLADAAIPQQAAADALHLGVATVNGVNFLATWNCRHLANATMRGRIEDVCRSVGYEPPLICTPEELLEVEADEG